MVLSLAAALPVLVATAKPQEESSQPPAQDTSAVQPMTMQDIIDMSKAGVGDKVIIDQMKATQSAFELSARDIVDLKNAGVSDQVIGAMIGRTARSRYAEGSAIGWYGYPPYAYYYPFYAAFGFRYFWPRLYVHHAFPFGYRAFYSGRGYGRFGGHAGGFGFGGRRGFGSHR